jgi:hypothetical protein
VALTKRLRVILLGGNRGNGTLLDLAFVFEIFGIRQTRFKKTPEPLPVQTNTQCRLLCRDVANEASGHSHAISEVVAARQHPRSRGIR